MLKKCLFSTVAVIQLASQTYSSNKIVYCIDSRDNYPAHGIIGSENGKNPGIFIEKMRFIANKTNTTNIYRRMPWKRCLLELEKNTIDGAICASYKPEREKGGVFPKKKDNKINNNYKFSNSSYYLYYRKGTKISWDGEILRPKNILVGGQSGYSIISFLTKMGIEVDTTKSDHLNFKKLRLGRLDAVAAHGDFGDSYTNKYPEIIKHPIPLTSKSYFIMFSHKFYKNNIEIVQKIWEASQIMYMEGLPTKLEKKYRIRNSWQEFNSH